GDFGYVHLRDFYTDAEEARSLDLLFLEQYNKMRTQGYDGRGLIIDLRLNQGGRLDFVDRMLALFVRENVIGYYLQEGDGERTPIRIRPAGRIEDDPIVILIDEKTDAGAVLFAAVMRLRRNSLVLGHHSGKHGIVHGLIPYRRNHLISVPDRYMIGPDESNLHGVGIAPVGDAYRVNEALRTSTSDDSAESFEAIRRQYAASERIFRSLIAEGAVNDPLIARAIALMNTRVTR
ncbi:MAG: hypothetical protein KDK30_14030, partial [Leptospiraceae bacterium]|nr:hypothetical protein [Leptospiraceae bacterium]